MAAIFLVAAIPIRAERLQNFFYKPLWVVAKMLDRTVVLYTTNDGAVSQMFIPGEKSSVKNVCS